MLLRRTKILATLGPATDKPGVLEELFEAGIDVVRLNFSHGSAQDHIDRANRVRAISKQTGRRVGILADLQGPKIRIERFKENKVWLEEGQDFALDINLGKLDGDNTQVGISYEPLAREVKPGTRLLLDDGRVVLDVVDVIDNTRVNTKVVVGGDLSNNKGINLLGGGLSAAALTDKDKEDIKTIAVIQADYVAISFPRTAADMNEARELLQAAGSYAGLVAKVERAEAMDVIDEIILASDAIMVARGDLGVEIGDANLPAAQKLLIQRARELNRAVITATQMMESMIENPIPTRAEVFDVANAIVDGTDAIMLSAETASGKHPVKTVQAMVRICLETEKQPSVTKSMHRMTDKFERIDEAIAMSAMYMANHTKIAGIASLTESGSTPLWMSRISSDIPIFAFSSCERTLGQVTLYKGVFPIPFAKEKMESASVTQSLIKALKARGVVKPGDALIRTKGDLTGASGGTNSLKVITVTD
ncbi:pyruvate kinase [Methylomonas methanica]|jgi:pyruvate kinase|uniref:Pyruvate kinase n=1 Tax=Methylomonas methanica TaxID=421 RepID=A0A177M433_METMH|nr:pyruvate kinase [Methylomonas methanica]OAI00304.1 pyruvate kinase [Methylomonas methanica]OAI06917.1 pyruvate kinase [Methylomonas methanica]